MKNKARELPGERDNAWNNARCTQARKTTHSMDGQHQHVDKTSSGRVNQNDRGQRWKKYVHGVANPRIDHRGRLNRTEQIMTEAQSPSL